MQFRRRLSAKANVDLIPMIDVVFQLVVFFMVSSTFALTPGIALDLPASSSTEPVVLNRLVVTVASPDEIYLNRDRVTIAELNTMLSETAKPDDGALSAIVEGDRSIPYETLVAVPDVLRRNGYRGIALRTLETDSR